MKEKILIVEDEKDVRDCIKMTLEYEGYQVDIALTGEEAVEKLGNAAYQLMLIDLSLGSSVTGRDVIKFCSHRQDRPVILVMSGNPKDMLKASFEEEGLAPLIHSILEKPNDLSPFTLSDIVKTALAKRQDA